jgi:hypothetical protein
MALNKLDLVDAKVRPKCSIPLRDADFALNNSNWTKGLQAMSDWIWSANLNPIAFPNHLARFFLHIPGIFEQQLNYSTSLIFDDPSFKNGIQISGFVDRVAREIAISTIAQTRRCWYTMTHHAVLGKLTALKHNVGDKEYTNKWVNLLNHNNFPECYTSLEHCIIDFAKCFATDPKMYTDKQYNDLRLAFAEYNKEKYREIEYPVLQQRAAKDAYAYALSSGEKYEEVYRTYLKNIPKDIPESILERKINAQAVEISFLCLQFVALSTPFTGLNIPDEDFLPSVIKGLLSNEVIAKINEYCLKGIHGDVPDLLPEQIPSLNVNGSVFGYVEKGKVTLPPNNLKGTRIPLTPYEGKDDTGKFRPAFDCSTDIDKGLTIGGIQVGVYGWGFGGHYPGSLVYCLMHHPELARFEAPYSLPLLFNEEEWRNGTQTAGFVSRKIKELVIQKIYRTNRSRYGLEHHIMFFYNAFLDEYGVGRNPNVAFTTEQVKNAREKATTAADNAALYIHDHSNAPEGIFSALESAILTWTFSLMSQPHKAYLVETNVREELRKANIEDVRMGLRTLDCQDKIGYDAAIERLIDHQICELAMLIGHMDGLGRVLSILKLEAEEAVQIIEGELTPTGIKPTKTKSGEAIFTGYFNNRPALHQIYGFLNISNKVLTLNELFLNPKMCQDLVRNDGVVVSTGNTPEF